MKKLILIFPLLLLFSCSIQKRKYQKGLYVNWHKHTAQPEKKSQIADRQKLKPATEAIVSASMPHAQEPEAPVVASNDKAIDLSVLKRKPLLSRSEPDTCDEIIFRSGEEVSAKILEITSTEIKYKRCDNMTGPLYVARKSEVLMVKYSNGTKETFKAEPPEAFRHAQSARSGQKSSHRVNHPLALLSLFCGAGSAVIGYGMLTILFGFMGGGPYTLFFIPLIIGLVGVFTGKAAINAINEQPDVYKGKGMAVPGFIIGLVVTIIAALLLVILLSTL